MDWIYLASNKKASLPQTINTIINSQLLWRSANNKDGARIANVSNLSVGDRLVVAWREGQGRYTAYLLCTIGTPLSPVHPGLVIDDLGHADAKVLEAAGYDVSREAEAIRLDNVDECYFQVAGDYKGNNALFRLDPADAAALVHAATIPPEARAEAQSVVQRVPAPKTRTPVVVSGVAAASPAGTASVDGFDVTGTGPRAFDAYVMVDWSSSSTKVTGKDSIWIAQGEWSNATFTATKPRNVSTRVQAISEIRADIESMQRQGKRVLVGFDFAFGYPAGFAKALGLATTHGAWSALHSYFAQNVKDAPNNAHNRDAFADECNRKIAGPGPFWGCTKGAASPTLTQHRVGVFDFAKLGLEEWRLTELKARMEAVTQSVWKLNCGVSVGGQTIVGIKHLDDLAKVVGGKRWPFDTGWGTPTQPEIWFAEIFPSLIRYPEWAREYATLRDRTQVQSCVRYAAELDATGSLAQAFAQPPGLDEVALQRVVDEEGWILFV